MATAKSESRVVSHTPGPWKWRIERTGLSMLVGGERQAIILDDACCNPQDEALIAAAPDLLEATLALLQIVGYQKPTALGAAVMIQAQAAVNKAKGGA